MTESPSLCAVSIVRWAEGPKDRKEAPQDDLHVTRDFRRATRNSGHPCTGALLELLRGAHGKPEPLKVAAEHQCDACLRYFSLRRARAFHKGMQVDVNHLRGRQILYIVEIGSQSPHSDPGDYTRWLACAEPMQEFMVDPATGMTSQCNDRETRGSRGPLGMSVCKRKQADGPGGAARWFSSRHGPADDGHVRRISPVGCISTKW